MAWLVLGRREAADRFGAMLRAGPTTPTRWPAAPTCGEAGRRERSPTRAAGRAASRAQRRRLVQPGLPARGGRPASEAEAAFRRALALDPKLDRAWYGLGLALIRQGRLDEAVAALKRNTELQPMSPYGWYQLARVHMDRQQPEEARKIIRHLKGFEPKVAAQLERETGLAS